MAKQLVQEIETNRAALLLPHIEEKLVAATLRHGAAAPRLRQTYPDFSLGLISSAVLTMKEPEQFLRRVQHNIDHMRRQPELKECPVEDMMGTAVDAAKKPHYFEGETTDLMQQRMVSTMIVKFKRLSGVVGSSGKSGPMDDAEFAKAAQAMKAAGPFGHLLTGQGGGGFAERLLQRTGHLDAETTQEGQRSKKTSPSR